MANKNNKLLPETVNAETLGLIFGLTPRRVQMLEKESVFKKKGRGKYVLAGAGADYAKYLAKSEIDRRTFGSVREELDAERLRKVRLENDQNENLLIPLDVARAGVDRMLGVLQSELAGVPVAATDDVAQRRRIEDGINRVLQSIAERFRKVGSAMAAGRDPSDAGEADDM